MIATDIYITEKKKILFRREKIFESFNLKAKSNPLFSYRYEAVKIPLWMDEK